MNQEDTKKQSKKIALKYKENGAAVVTVEFEATDLDKVLRSIRNFLRACGYSIEGDLVVKENGVVDPSSEEGSSGNA